MKMNRFSLAAALALALGGALACADVATAQSTNAPARNRRPSAEQQLERMTTELSLTDAQKPKVKEWLENSAKQRQELRTLAQDERAEKRRSMMAEQNKKLKEILTPEQFEKFQKLMEQRRSRGGGANRQPGSNNTNQN